jgi:hypothetical protein
MTLRFARMPQGRLDFSRSGERPLNIDTVVDGGDGAKHEEVMKVMEVIEMMKSDGGEKHF